MAVITTRNSFNLTKILCAILIVVTIITFVVILCKIDNHETEEPVKMKYILLWTLPTRDPIKYLGVGQNTFINRKCPITNCYVSADRELFGDVKKFDVLVFHSSDITATDLPKSRSVQQKYVFASMESADYYLISDAVLNNFFNWTWTYKLNSDVEYGYISIKNNNGDLIGPKEVMHWKTVEEMNSIDEVLKQKLERKKYAAAWFVSNCKTHSKREIIAQTLKIEMAKHGLILDIYGNCGSKKCPRSAMSSCWQLLERDYYFYLSFENSFCTDYVTEKLLHALQHKTIPIVYGGANYTRFMPDGIYLDAWKMSTKQLAKKMADLINNKEEYYDYFKWHNHYSYHRVEDSPNSDPYCKFCSMINQRLKASSMYNDFTSWWTS